MKARVGAGRGMGKYRCCTRAASHRDENPRFVSCKAGFVLISRPSPQGFSQVQLLSIFKDKLHSDSQAFKIEVQESNFGWPDVVVAGVGSREGASNQLLGGPDVYR